MQLPRIRGLAHFPWAAIVMAILILLFLLDCCSKKQNTNISKHYSPVVLFGLRLNRIRFCCLFPNLRPKGVALNEPFPPTETCILTTNIRTKYSYRIKKIETTRLGSPSGATCALWACQNEKERKKNRVWKKTSKFIQIKLSYHIYKLRVSFIQTWFMIYLIAALTSPCAPKLTSLLTC